jgi:hypothetical protein
MLKELSEQENVFFRFHDPDRRLSNRSKSWGMIFESEREALSCGSTVLEGKSCTETAEELMRWAGEFDNSYVIIVFEGQDTKEEGHDGEAVATYNKKIKCFSYQDFVSCFEYKEFDSYTWIGNRQVLRGHVYKES